MSSSGISQYSTGYERLYGKYRGKVVDNEDPEGKGKIRVKVEFANGEENVSNWAEPCVPYAGNGVGFYAIPPVGANVWVEFLGGYPDQPVWTGCYWGKEDNMPEEKPTQKQKPEIKVWRTEQGIIRIDDKAGEILIQLNSGQKILMKDGQILIDNANGSTVDLDCSTVKINKDGLQVT